MQRSLAAHTAADRATVTLPGETGPHAERSPNWRHPLNWTAAWTAARPMGPQWKRLPTELQCSSPFCLATGKPVMICRGLVLV